MAATSDHGSSGEPRRGAIRRLEQRPGNTRRLWAVKRDRLPGWRRSWSEKVACGRGSSTRGPGRGGRAVEAEDSARSRMRRGRFRWCGNALASRKKVGVGPRAAREGGMPCGCNTSAARTHTPTLFFGPASELQRRSITASQPPSYRGRTTTRPRIYRGIPPPLITPRGAAPCAFASARPSVALRSAPAIMNDRTETESITTSVIHPTPCFRSGRSLRETEEAAGKLVPESLAARLAWRRSAVAPWLCVTAFQRLCSLQRFAISRVHDSARGPRSGGNRRTADVSTPSPSGQVVART